MHSVKVPDDELSNKESVMADDEVYVEVILVLATGVGAAVQLVEIKNAEASAATLTRPFPVRIIDWVVELREIMLGDNAVKEMIVKLPALK